MSSPSFLKLRGPDAQQSRSQDNISAQVVPIGTALARTPIMGAPPPAWISPDLPTTLANYGNGFAPAQYHKDALGYVHVGGKITSAAGVAAGTTLFTLKPGYRPSSIHTFVVEGGLGLFQFIYVYPTGIVACLLAIGAAETISLEAIFLAEQ